MQDANYGMGSPHGYRTALRLMRLAERFGLPVVTLVDTVGAWPTFECERDGQSEAIATNLTIMAGLTVPIVTILVGEGGSGGALGIGMGNIIGVSFFYRICLDPTIARIASYFAAALYVELITHYV
jgi:acetyl-CoA carboxylase alpha subunit